MQILKFSAPWCGPCNSIKHFFWDLKKNYPEVDFKEYDIAETEDHLNYGIMSVPTVLLMDGDKEVTRYIGAKTKEEYEELFKKALN